MAMTWRTFSYTTAILIAVVLIATNASFGDVGGDSTSATPVLAVQPQSEPAPASRMVLLAVGVLAVGVTYRQALSNLRSRR